MFSKFCPYVRVFHQTQMYPRILITCHTLHSIRIHCILITSGAHCILFTSGAHCILITSGAHCILITSCAILDILLHTNYFRRHMYGVILLKAFTLSNSVTRGKRSENTAIWLDLSACPKENAPYIVHSGYLLAV